MDLKCEEDPRPKHSNIIRRFPFSSGTRAFTGDIVDYVALLDEICAFYKNAINIHQIIQINKWINNHNNNILKTA